MKFHFRFKPLPMLIGAFLLINVRIAAAEPIALTWENDIQPIVNTSCTSCHNGPRASGGIALETEDQILKLNARIKSVVSNGQMPIGEPTFAASPEGKKLLTWLASQAEPQLSWDKDIKPIVAANCSTCHGTVQPSAGLVLETEAQMLKLNLSITNVVTKGQMPAGNPDFATSVEGKKLLTWLKIQATTVPQISYLKNIKPIIATNCQSCHTAGNANGGLAFDAEFDLVKNSKIIAAEVSSGDMPVGDATFKSSADAKILLDWIKSLKPTAGPAI